MSSVEVVQTNIFEESQPEIKPLLFNEDDFGTPRELFYPTMGPADCNLCQVCVLADPLEVSLMVNTSPHGPGRLRSQAVERTGLLRGPHKNCLA